MELPAGDRRSFLFLDNGGYNVKALYFSDINKPPTCLVIPNCVGAASYAGRGIVGDQIRQLAHFHGFLVRRPIDRGFVVDGFLQAYIWEYLLQHFAVEDETTVELLLTVPFGAPKAVAGVFLHLFTQRFRFASVTFVSSSFLTLLAYTYASSVALPLTREGPAATRQGMGHKRARGVEGERSSPRQMKQADEPVGGCAIVVDMGFSGTVVVPYIDFFPVYSSIVRIDVGGKVLTNRLKEHLSFTQVNVMEDGWLINHIKEQCCAVSLHPRRMLRHFQAIKKSTVQRGQRGVKVGLFSSFPSEPSCEKEGFNTEATYYLPAIPALLPLGCTADNLTEKLKSTGSNIDVAGLQKVVLKHERYLIPELLFVPDGVGVEQMGVVQAATEGVFQRGLLQRLPLLRCDFLSHVYLFGGECKFPNFFHRFYDELTQRVDVDATTNGLELRVPTKAVDMDTNLSQTSHVEHASSDLQPLYGAYLLWTNPFLESHRKALWQRSRLQFHGKNVPRCSIEQVHEVLQHLL